ncbi:UNVERIFIED_CONTAM: hypothetical protein Sindi_1382500 [Sesamum indicum]
MDDRCRRPKYPGQPSQRSPKIPLGDRDAEAALAQNIPSALAAALSLCAGRGECYDLLWNEEEEERNREGLLA